VRRRLLAIGILALTTGAGLGVRAMAVDSPVKDPDRPLKSFVGVMGALQDFNTNVCTVESPAVFDVTEIGRRALGRHAHDRSKADVAELGELVARLLLRWYARVLHPERRATTDLIFGTGTAIGSWATISAITPRRRQTFVYHLRWTVDGGWRVYDIEVDGRSQIRTYYTMFDRIIFNERYRVLVRSIKAEVDRDEVDRDEAPRAANAGKLDRCRSGP